MLIAFKRGGNDGVFTCPVCHSLRKKTKHCEGANCPWLKCKPCGIAMNPKNRRVIKLSKK